MVNIQLRNINYKSARRTTCWHQLPLLTYFADTQIYLCDYWERIVK